MSDFKNVMVDLETMGNSSNSAIISIGAVAFNKEIIGPEFYCVVDLESSMKSGASLDASTVMWWMKQSDAARAQFNSAKTKNLAKALQDFTFYMQGFGSDKVKLWGNGAAFDNVILSSAYKMCQLKQPWKFWNDMCYRTLKNMNPDVKMDRSGVYHNALDDAKSQALHLIKILNK